MKTRPGPVASAISRALALAGSIPAGENNSEHNVAPFLPLQFRKIAATT